MNLLTVACYVADAAILATYGAWALLAKPGRWFNAANALGGPVLLAGEIVTGAWFVIPITGTFTVVGWLALLTGEDD